MSIEENECQTITVEEVETGTRWLSTTISRDSPGAIGRQLPAATSGSPSSDWAGSSVIGPCRALKSLGLGYIPGMMSGMILAGSNPIYAALYQFVIMGMLFAASGLTSMLSIRLVGQYAFTEADQLKLFEEPDSASLIDKLMAEISKS